MHLQVDAGWTVLFYFTRPFSFNKIYTVITVALVRRADIEL